MPENPSGQGEDGRATLLAGLRVLDLTSGVAGSYCTKLLADLGASVLKIESPEGDLTRRIGPFPGDARNLEASGVFLYLNSGKLSCVLDLEGGASARERLDGLISQADIVVENFSTTKRSSLGFEPERILKENPGLVLTSLTPFGLTGPYKGWETEEIVEWALGGYMYFGGEPARPPLTIPGHQSDLHAGMQAAFASLVAFFHTRQTGLGQHIDVSHWESVLGAHAWLTVMWSHCGSVTRRRGKDFLRCADGFVYIVRGAFYHPNLFLLIERPDLIDDPRWNTHGKWTENGEELWKIVEEWTEDRTKQEIVAKSQELRIAISPINTVEDLAASAQLAARDWFADVHHPVVGKVRLPGVPYRFSDAAVGPSGPAPYLGQHTDEVLSGKAWPARERTPTASSHPQSTALGPLDGVRVVEITANWAGPLTGRMLGDLGAEVIKVEVAARPATRFLYYVGNEPGKHHYNRSGYFNSLNRNKLGISLDLGKPHGREVFLRLIERADVFVENNATRVVRNLGIAWEDVKQVNPRLVMLSQSAFGATGPESQYVAYGANIETTSGLASVIGYGPGEVYRTGSFYADPIAGAHGALAVIAALLDRQRTGRGQYIDLSLLEGVAAFMGEALMDYFLNGHVAEPRGNRHRSFAPQGCYPCAGEDMWMALCVRSDDEWQRLCRVAGHPDWAERPELATEQGRRNHHDELDGMISEWTRRMDHWEASRLLQDRSIPAAPVLANWEILYDPHLFARQFYVTVPHPEAGVLPYAGFPWKFSRTPAAIRMGAPCFAEHNDLVYREILDLDDAEIQRLEEEGCIDTNPDTPIVRAL